MHKTKKSVKINNRLKQVNEEKLFKLYNVLPYACQSCMNDCKDGIKDDTEDCLNYVRAIELNDLIDMLHKENVCLDSLCRKYGLKKEYLLEMLRGEILFSYKYYYYICKRCHVKEFDEFNEYSSRFEENEIEESYQLESEVGN